MPRLQEFASPSHSVQLDMKRWQSHRSPPAMGAPHHEHGRLQSSTIETAVVDKPARERTRRAFLAPPTRELRVVGPETLGGTSRTTETAVVDKPEEEPEHAGHHHGHAH
jgi:hypothetical protein